ncbi:MAG TPA: hypothetical protein VFS19_05320 [Planctomycetota bacterium]|nr:hypothetical protein [Planctomycetota bacterium]
MKAGLCYVAAGLFMIAAANFAGNAQHARGDEGIIPGLGALFSGFMVIVLIVCGIVASVREGSKDKA